MNQRKENAITSAFSRGSKQCPRFGPVSLHLGEKWGGGSGAFTVNSYIELSLDVFVNNSFSNKTPNMCTQLD